jgi:hypothetical protein
MSVFLLIPAWISGLAAVCLFWANVIYFALYLFDKIAEFPMPLLYWGLGAFVVYIVCWIGFIITAVLED